MKIKIVTDKKALKAFIRLPARLHKEHKNWVPPIYREEWKYFSQKSNPSFGYCDTLKALCYMNGTPVGRVMGIINHRYNKIKGEKHARFSCFESINDQNVADLLLQNIEDWALKNGMDKVIGPYGMNYLDPEGFLIEGFEYPPTISTNYNFEYYNDMLIQSGYIKEKDYVVYKIDLPNNIPEVYYKIRSRLLENGAYKVLEFSGRRSFRKSVKPILHLMNDCFDEIYGYSFLDDYEIDRVCKQYTSLMDPRFIKVVTQNNEFIGFIVGMPNISEGLRKSKGKLYPLGFLKILSAMKHSKQLDLLLGGVKKEYRGIGLDVLLGTSMVESATAAGFKLMDTHNELESNYKVRAEMERMGGVPYKRYRVFQKQLLRADHE